ncbi:MAG: hypothetical protein ACLFV6_02010 [Spirulinaceae cyanobacterium]
MSYFEDGNYIYECKSSPDRMGDAINQRSLSNWLYELRKLLKRKKPSGFRYIFPVNRLDSRNKELLTKLQNDFSDIDIQYYDCDSVDLLIFSLEKVQTLPELVAYIQKARIS